MRLRFLIVIALVGLFLLHIGDVATAKTDPAAHERLPALEVILREWAAAMSVDRPRQVQFRRHDYDHVFHQEERGSGSFSLSRDKRARFLIAPVEIPEGKTSGKLHNGVPYDLTPSTPFETYWDDSNVYQLDPTHMTAWHTPRHPEVVAWFDLFRGLRHPNTAFPLMLGMSEEELKTNYEWKLDEKWKRRDTEIHLMATPRITIQDGTKPFKDHLEQGGSSLRIEVLLDRRTYETYALRFGHSTHRETVYVIDRIVDVTGEFWTPDLTGYKVQ